MYHLQQGVSVFHGDAIAKEEEKKKERRFIPWRLGTKVDLRADDQRQHYG